MSAKGFLLVIANDESRLRFVGFPESEGHTRSHAFRDALALGGAQTTIVANLASPERSERARAKEASE